ncbi:family 16 glycoside hydrolase [Pedobacter miscanthi]|nr:family 16 glycoside hydrolase [Pedobacter miscanthi]
MFKILSFSFVGVMLIPCALYAQNAVIKINADKVENKISPLIYGSNIEDVNHEIYGGFYDQRIFGESFEEPSTGVNFNQWRRFSGFWTGNNGVVAIKPGRNTKSEVKMNGIHHINVEPDHSAKLIYEPQNIADGAVEAEMRFTHKGDGGGLIFRVSDEGVGDDAFNGYEVSLSAGGKKIALGKHLQNFRLLKEASIDFLPQNWNKLRLILKGRRIEIFFNTKHVLSFTDNDQPILSGRIGLRTWKSDLEFRNISISDQDKTEQIKLLNAPNEQVSYNWDLIKSGNAKATFEIDSASAYNGKKSQVINFIGGKGKIGVANRSLNRWGIAVKKNQLFQGRIYLKGTIEGAVSIALESKDGTKTYAKHQINAVGKDWKKFVYNLNSNATDANARLAVYLTSKGKLWIDQVVLMVTGTDQFKGLPIRADIGKMLVLQGLTFLRYAGTMVNAPDYKFKNMIGDPDKRPPYRGHWNWYTSNGFGIEEFLKFCEQTKITPCFAVNIYETPDDMADMVEYLNGDKNSTWGAKRAENGHPEPYHVKYIEIGNEEVIFNGDSKAAYEEYVKRFKILADAMRKKDASLKLVQAAWWRPDSPNMEYVFKELNGKADYWDLHVGGDDPSAGTETDKQLTDMLGRFRKWDPNTKMKIAVFEENGSKHGIQRALGHATNMNAIRKHSEDVLTSSPANALQPDGQNDNDWDQGQIFFTSDQVWGMPPFYAQKMQAENHLPLRVNTVVNGNLDVSAARSEDEKELVLYVINTGAETIDARLEITGFENRKPEVNIAALSGNLQACNTAKKQKEYSTRYSKELIPENNPVYRFQPFSYTILRFTKN